METKDIIILTAAFALAGFSLYRKYMKKQNSQEQNNRKPAGEFASDSDDYEPYSGK